MIIYYIVMVLGVIIAGFSQILLKKSSMKTYSSHIYEYLNPYVIIGYGMMVVSTVCTLIAFKGMAYSSGPVLESLGYLFITILSMGFFKEKLTLNKVVGNMLIILGIVIFYI